MKGHVDSFGRALLQVEVAVQESASLEPLDVWVDTGFTGDLVFPQDVIDRIGLRESGTVEGVLADGTVVRLRRYCCWIDWFSERRLIEVIANNGQYPLLGVGLLVGRELNISYSAMTLVVE